MRLLRLTVLVSCFAVFPVLAGCGTDDEAALPAGAELVPAQTVLFIALDTDFDSDQWQTAGDLLDKFPDGDKARSFILGELSKEGVDLEGDIKPALGPQVNIAWLDAADEDAFVGFTQPSDEAKLRALLEKDGEEIFFRDVEGWTAFATNEKYLDMLDVATPDGSLAADSRFVEAMGHVAEDALVRLYFNGPAAETGLSGSADVDLGAVAELLPGGTVPWVSASLSAEDGGGRVDGAVGFAGDPTGFVSPSYEANLPDVAPAGALAYFSFKDLESQLSTFRDLFAQLEPDVERDIGRFEAEVGVSLEEDIGPLLAGEGALYVRQGLFIPEVTLLLEVEDEANAMAVLDGLVAGLRDFVPLGEARTIDVEGVEARQVDIEAPLSIFYAAFDGHLVVTSQRAGIAAIRADGDRLSGDDRFQQALSDAGMPDETAGFAYVDLKEIIAYALGFAGAAQDVPDEVGRNLEPLEHLVFFSTREDNVVEFSGFLALD